ncbi:BPSL0067 family protein [Variovorax ureilyticus]|uniref:BPSL0067 family protein n=1 Tax=Variovorax ureilyticus TaxID=1836198 RepID=A0ABU8VBH6_9BURK
MPYVHSKAEDLDDTDLVGTHQCVVLLQHYAKVPHTSSWTEGRKVHGNASIAKGTAIATFVNGKYPNRSTGDHAAFYLSQNAGGIWVVDQWKHTTKLKVQRRYLKSLGKNKDGTFVDPSNNADALSIIE